MSTLTEELNKDADDPSIDRRFAVGALQGMCFGISIAVVLLLFGAAIPAVWHWSASLKTTVDAPPKPFELMTVYTDVPFIRLSNAAIANLDRPGTRQAIEDEMGAQWYFGQELLKGRTRYRPIYRDEGSARRAFTFRNGGIERIAVQLVMDDGSLGRYGLIPLEEYQADIRNLK